MREMMIAAGFLLAALSPLACEKNYTVAPQPASAAHWQNVGNADFSSGSAAFPSLFFSNGTAYVAYADSVYGGNTLMSRAESPLPLATPLVWQSVGSPGFGGGTPTHTSLYIDQGIPYVAYQDSLNGYKASVMTFNGSSWTYVGNAGFSAGEAGEPSISVDNGTPYVAFTDSSLVNPSISVMKYNGNAWVYVGSQGFTPKAVESSLFISNGTPYVAFTQDFGAGNNFGLSVVKFDGSAWVTVGSPDFNSNTDILPYPSLFVGNGTPYVAYEDNGNGNKASVEMYNGSSWIYLGSEDFSPALGYQASLFVYGTIPYMAFEDGSTPNTGASVMEYNGSTWVYVGKAGFSPGSAGEPSLSVSNGIPYVAFLDGTVGEVTVMKYE
jgi:hypothetical protein